MVKCVEEDTDGFARLNGYSIKTENGQVVMVISPENSYYTNASNNNIQEHLKCCIKNFSKVYVMIPEGPMVHDYLAEGYDVQSAQRKSRLKCNNLRNKTQRSIDALVSNGNSAVGEKIEVLDWTQDIETDKNYIEELYSLTTMYLFNERFRTTVNSAVVDVLKNRKKGKVGEKATSVGSNYVLEELAFMVAAPKMFNQEKMCYSYHKSWKIFEDYINGEFDGKEKKELGFVVIA
jgi:tRNA-dependent cyclodipeptide synthase